VTRGVRGISRRPRQRLRRLRGLWRHPVACQVAAVELESAPKSVAATLGFTPSEPGIMPPILLGSLLLVWLTLVSAAIGRVLLRLLRVPPFDGAVRGVFSTALGVGVLQFLPFSMFALGIGTPRALHVAAVLLTVGLLPSIWAVMQSGARWLARPRHLPWWSWGVRVALLVAMAAAFLRSLCPIHDADSLAYHLTIPFRYLAVGRFEYLPTLTFSNWPLGVEMVHGLLHAMHDGAPTAVVSVLLIALMIAATYLLGRHVGGEFAGLVAAGAFLLSANLWRTVPTAFVNTGSGLFATLALYAIVVAHDEPLHRRQWFRLSALLAGLCATVKLNNVCAVAALTVVVALAARSSPARHGSGSRPRAWWRPVVVYATIALAVGAPWFVKTWVLTGNPLYPMFYGLLGGIEWTAGGWARMQGYYLAINLPPFLPLTRAALLGTRLVETIAAAGVCWALFVICRRGVLAWVGRYTGLCWLLLVASGGTLTTYWITAIPAALVCFGFAVRAWERRLAPVVALVSLVLATYISVPKLEPDLATATRVALGLESGDEYLGRVLLAYPINRWANNHLSASARILVGAWDDDTALYRAVALRPNFLLQDSIHYDSQQQLDEDLARLGVTHLVFKPIEPPGCAAWYTCFERRRVETPALEELIRRRGGPPLFTANGYALYALQAAPRTGRQD
jgi:hypothetical protein